MHSIVISLLVFVASIRSDFLLPFNLSVDLINHTAQLEHSNHNNSVCELVSFNYCQNAFNVNLGINNALTYRNGTFIYNDIQSLLNINVTELHRVCRARNNFYHCLGQSYYSCLNLHERVKDTDPSNAFDYVRLFRGLEWVCGGGFRESIAQFDCFENFTYTPTYQSCIATFTSAISTSNFCPAIQLAQNCLNSAYSAACGDQSSGHWACENFRFIFDRSCHGLQCSMGN